MLRGQIAQHLAQMRVGSERTRREYANDLERFATWAESEGLAVPAAITAADIERYISSLRRRHDGRRYSPHARNRALSAIKGFFGYLVKAGVIAGDRNPAAHLEAERIPRRHPVFLHLDEGAELIRHVEQQPADTPFQAFYRARNLAILAILLGTGIRISELAQLNVDTWEEAARERELRVIGKGNKERIVPPSDEAFEYVHEYLKLRPAVPADELGEPLLVSRNRRRLTVRQIEALVKEWARAAVPGKRITPHKLRSTWVTQLVLSGANIREIQEMAGHDDLSTTMVYAGVDRENLKRTIAKHQVRYR